LIYGIQGNVTYTQAFIESRNTIRCLNMYLDVFVCKDKEEKIIDMLYEKWAKQLL